MNETFEPNSSKKKRMTCPQVDAKKSSNQIFQHKYLGKVQTHKNIHRNNRNIAMFCIFAQNS